MRALLLFAATLSSWSFAHRGGPPALADAPVGPYTLTYFDDLHVGTAEAVLLLSGADAEDAALTLYLTSPSGNTLVAEVEHVRATPANQVFVARAPITEAGAWRARVSVTDASGTAAREVTVSTKGRFAGFWLEAAPYLSIALSLVSAFAAVWHFAVPSPRPLEVPS